MSFLQPLIDGGAFYWWQSQVKEKPREVIGSGLGILGFAVVVRVVWGKQMAVLFVPAAFRMYPVLHDYIWQQMDVSQVLDVGKVIAIPCLCMMVPKGAVVLMPVHIVVMGMMLRTHWERGKEKEEERKKMEQAMGELQRAVEALLKTESGEEVDLVQKIQKLAGLCQQITEAAFKSKLRQINGLSQDKIRLEEECTRLKQLAQELKEEVERVRAVTGRVGETVGEGQRLMAELVKKAGA